VLNEAEPPVVEAAIAEKLLLEFKVRVAAASAAPCTEVPSTAKVDDGPPEKLTGVPTVVVDQLVNGVVAADDELVLEELLPPAQAIKVIGKTKMARFFKITPSSQLWQMKLAFSYIYSGNHYNNPISHPIKRSLVLESY
jgi:hypothetical protein